MEIENRGVGGNTFFRFNPTSDKIKTKELYFLRAVSQDNLLFYVTTKGEKSYTGPTGSASGSGWNDISGNKNHAEIFSGVSFTGGNMVHDGTGNRPVRWSYSTPTNNFSVMIWARTSQTHEIDAESTSGTSGLTGQHYVIWPNHGGSSTVGGAGISYGTNGISSYEHGAGFIYSNCVYNGTVGSNFVNICLTYDSKQPRIYLDGDLVRTGLTSTKTTVNGPVSAGSVDPNGFDDARFNGDLNLIAVWNTTLTATQVKQNYRLTKDLF